jgi:hypothetical protein
MPSLCSIFRCTADRNSSALISSTDHWVESEAAYSASFCASLSPRAPTSSLMMRMKSSRFSSPMSGKLMIVSTAARMFAIDARLSAVIACTIASVRVAASIERVTSSRVNTNPVMSGNA